MSSGNQLKCTICDTSIEVPLCCEEGMKISDGTLKCVLCNSNKEIPICCGKKNMMISHPNK
jgi:hypothetical protein|tara:strand:+ start:3935 stop:4117 length:183 start_codon:yes stop_codon:yes gene_type:complete